MSAATKRKYVTKEVLGDFVLPEPNQQIVKICGGRGNNLHDAVTAEGQKFIVSMPTKFRKNIWIKRGNFVIVDPIEEGDKVKGEITHILYKEQIKYIKQNSLWPAVFDDNTKDNSNDPMIPADMLPPSEDEEEYSDDENLETDSHRKTLAQCNPNRHIQFTTHSDESSDEEEEDDDD